MKGFVKMIQLVSRFPITAAVVTSALVVGGCSGSDPVTGVGSAGAANAGAGTDPVGTAGAGAAGVATNDNGGTASAGAGGAPLSGGSSSLGGAGIANASGGSLAGGDGSSGSAGHGGLASGGAAGAAGGLGDLNALAASLNKLRVDDACGTLGGSNTCFHVTNKDADPYSANKVGTMGGESGTTYQVKFHVYGIVEGTHITGGTPGTPSNFKTGGMVETTTNAPDYNQWRITVSKPAQYFYVNAFDSLALAHKVYVLDFKETIAVAAGATVTLDVYDRNGHLISNTAKPIAVPPTGSGVDGSVNSGQFVQLNVENVAL